MMIMIIAPEMRVIAGMCGGNANHGNHCSTIPILSIPSLHTTVPGSCDEEG
jgi:hypothetical protein